MQKKKIKKQNKKIKVNKKPKVEFVEFIPLNKAAEAAVYFGFTPAKALQVTKDDISKANSLKDSWTRANSDLPWMFSSDFAEERASLLRKFTEENMISLPQPVMIVHEGETIKERAKSTINLEVVGTNRSIAEALLIKTAISILKDNGHDNFMIEINSIGDKESMNKFSKDLVSYYKKNINSLAPHCRQNFKKDAFYVLLCNDCDPENKIKDAAPTSIGSLSDLSRIHFKEVLEFIETMEIPYRIKNSLVPNRKTCSGTVFEIKELDEKGNPGDVLAVGFRYDGLAQKIGYKRDVPGAGLKLFIKKKDTSKKFSKLEKPIAFYIQLGDEAKHKSLEVIEILMREKIFIYHMLGRDKFGSQFSLVEKMKVPYVIIMGKKEYLENSVMVRENINRKQETVSIENLSGHLRSMKDKRK